MSVSKEKQIQKQLLEFQDRLSMETPPFPDNTKAAISERHDRSMRSVDAFAEMYMPHYLDSESAEFHYDLDAIAQSGPGVYALHGPREHAKSTRLRIKLLQMLCSGKVHYWLMGSEKLSLAWDHIEYLSWEFDYNPRLAADYTFKEIKKDETVGKFRFQLTCKATGKKHHIMLQAVSYGTSGKGLLFMQYRPQGCFLDDFENSRTSRNSKIGAEKTEWVIQELYPACTGPIVWLGNMGRETSALYQFMQRIYPVTDDLKAFLKRGSTPGAYAKKGERAQAQDEDVNLYGFSFRAEFKREGKTCYLWPQRFAPTWYAKKKATMGYLYEGEMNGAPVKPGKIFKAENIGRYSELPKGDLIWYAWFDPAWGRSGTSSYKAWIIMATDGHDFYVVDAYCRQGTPIADALDRWHDAFLKYEELGFRFGNYEGTFAQDQRLEQDIDAAEDRHGWRLNVYPKDNPGDKHARCQSMDGPLNSGKVLFPERPNKDVAVVLDQVLEYPDGEYFDGLDALEATYKGIRKLSRNNKMVTKTLGSRRFGFKRHSRR